MEQSPVHKSPFLRSAEAARYLNISLSVFYGLVRTGAIKTRPHGGILLFLIEDLMAYSERRALEREAEIQAKQKPLSKFQEARQRVAASHRSLKTDDQHDRHLFNWEEKKWR